MQKLPAYTAVLAALQGLKQWMCYSILMSAVQNLARQQGQQ